MENVNFTIFWFVVSLLASIGVLQTPWLYGFVFRRHLRCPRLLGIGILQTPMTDTIVFRKNMAMSSDNMNQPSGDICGVPGY